MEVLLILIFYMVGSCLIYIYMCVCVCVCVCGLVLYMCNLLVFGHMIKSIRLYIWVVNVIEYVTSTLLESLQMILEPIW